MLLANTAVKLWKKIHSISSNNFKFSVSCRQCPEEPSEKNQPDGDGKEASTDKLPTAVPWCDKTSAGFITFRGTCSTHNQPAWDSQPEPRRWYFLTCYLLTCYYKICCLNRLFMDTDYSLKLQSVETRCRILEKQLNYMRKMVENGNNERKAVMEKQVFQKSANRNKFHLQTFI